MICMLFIWVNYTYLTQFNMTQYKKEQYNIKFLKSLDTNLDAPYWGTFNQTVKHKISNDLSMSFYNQNATLNLTGTDEGGNPYANTTLSDFGRISTLLYDEEEALHRLIEANVANFQTMNLYGILMAVSMMFYVLTKKVFNQFATVDLPDDLWSKVDLFCALFQIISQSLTSTITAHVIDSKDIKVYYNILQIVTILATWFRLFSLLFVVEKFSKLISTILEMLTGGLTFLAIVVCYLIMMSSFAMCIFQEHAITYSTFIYTMRTLFDAMLGMYDYGAIRTNYKQIHTLFMIFHIYVANIFLLNYLVAILSTIYEEMDEGPGDFMFKCYKYNYIERYELAFQDDLGYNELVLHPPPLNFFSVFLWPFLFSSKLMKKYSLKYSIINFWAENIFVYIPGQFLYELWLIPQIYIKIAFNIVKLADPFQKVYLIIFWLIYGPFYLMYGVFFDIYYYVQILRDYKIAEDPIEIEDKEREKNDKIVIYNEIKDVIQSIYYIFLMKMQESTGDGLSQTEKNVMESMDIQQCITFLEKSQEKESDEILEGYTIDKKWLAEAWAIYRNKKMDIQRRQQIEQKRGKKTREETETHVNTKTLKVQ